MSDSSKKPKVSVTVVTYNHGEWLRECLESIVTQKTDFPFEVIVGDDASTDRVTRDILADYANRYSNIVVPIFRPKNIGGTQNYLDVVSQVNGKYIAHIDGDDVMLPGKLQKQADFLDRHPQCSMVTHDVYVINGIGELIKQSFLNYIPPEISDINYLVLEGCYFSHCSKMYRRSSIISTHRNSRTVDFFYHIENASKGNIGFISEILGKYRKAAGTASDLNSSTYRTLHQCYLEAFQRAIELGVQPAFVKKGMLRYQYGLALDYLRSGNFEGFRNRISLGEDEWGYSSWKHKIVYLLKDWPKLVSLIGHVKESVKC